MTSPSSIVLRIEFLRYVAVGMLCSLVDILLSTGLSHVIGLRHHHLPAAIGATTGLSLGYILSILWVFHARTFANRFVEIALFAAIGLLVIAINCGLTDWLTTLGWSMSMGKLVAIPVAGLVDFVLKRLVLFNPGHRAKAVPQALAAARPPAPERPLAH